MSGDVLNSSTLDGNAVDGDATALDLGTAQSGAMHYEAGGLAGELSRFPEGVVASAAVASGMYDARRLRSQRETIRDVMLSAADCGTWLTLGELRALTRYGEASISAQLRHLRKEENGGYDLVKRHRDGACAARAAADGRGDCVWEYRLGRGAC